jgi:hypothetical protein
MSTHVMTLEEIDLSLPNGFHDSSIVSVRLDYVQRTAEIDLKIHVSGPDDENKEKYQPATLFISGLVYFVIEPPGPPNIAHAEPSRVDGGSSELEQAAYPLPKPLPDGAFTYWFFVSNWNSFIHIAALSADLRVH